MANLIDSSVWVALFLDFDTKHKDAVSVLKELRGKIYLPYCVVSEVVTILAYKHSKEQANGFIDYIENNSDVEIVKDDLWPELEFYKTLESRVSLTDAALALLSRSLKAELVTFDKQLKGLAKLLVF